MPHDEELRGELAAQRAALDALDQMPYDEELRAELAALRARLDALAAGTTAVLYAEDGSALLTESGLELTEEE